MKKLFFDAIKGEERDYTQGSIKEAVLLLAIPMILEICLESIFALVDMFFVSKLGSNAIATVGLTESVITIVYSLAIGVGAGATAIVARRIGEKRASDAALAGAQALLIAFLISLIVSFFGILFGHKILKLMGASEVVVREGAAFTRIMLGGNLVIFLLFLINGIFRGAGNAAMAMKSLWIASGTNIILCPIFIHYFGLTGAAWATVIGRTTGVCFQVFHLFFKDHSLKMRLNSFIPHKENILSIIDISWPASVQFLISSGSWILLTKLVAESGGTAASAGYQIALRNFIFFILPAWGLSNAAATLVGQNLGAKKLSRAEDSVLVTMKYSVYSMFFVSIFLTVFTKPLVQLFTTDQEVLSYGIKVLRIFGSGFIFYGASMVLSQALNGAGDTKIPTRLNLLCFWAFQTPLAYFLTKNSKLSTLAPAIVVPLAYILLTALLWVFFKRGHWKKVQV